MSSPQSQLDLRRYLRVLRRWRWVFAGLLIVLPVLAYYASRLQAKQYQASVVMQVQAATVDTSLFDGAAPPSSGQPIAVAARLSHTSAVARSAAARLPRHRDPGALLRATTVEVDPDTGFLTITATEHSAADAAAVAGAFARAVIDSRASDAERRLETTIAQLNAQLSLIRDRVGRAQLSNQLQRLRALRAAQGSNATIIEPAVVPRSPTAPRPWRAFERAIPLALLLALGAVVVLEALDRRLREPTELEELTDLPLLSSIPATAFGSADSTDVHEAFYTLRASLSYFNVDEKVSSVLVTSPGQADGKTTVAVNLAIALARAGRDVLLVDADLRRPMVTARLGLQAGGGLSTLLAGDETLAAVTVDATPASAQAGRLRVLPAGPVPPNPSELLASRRMRDLIGELRTAADIVLIDTTPVLAVSDAIPLLEQVAGVLVVARLNHTSRDSIRRLLAMVAAGHGTALGVVATGVTRSDGYGYGYGYGYGRDDSGGSDRGNGRGGLSRGAGRRVRTPGPPAAGSPSAGEYGL